MFGGWEPFTPHTHLHVYSPPTVTSSHAGTLKTLEKASKQDVATRQLEETWHMQALLENVTLKLKEVGTNWNWQVHL